MYTLGKENRRVNALSRRHNLAGNKTTINTAILQKELDRSLRPRQINNTIRITNEVPKEL